MKQIYHNELSPKDDEIVLVGGSSETGRMCDEYGFKRYVTVEEMAGLFPELVPLSHKAGYPGESALTNMEGRVKERLGIKDVSAIMSKMRFKGVMLFSNPFMYETHMQIMSDALISKDGLLGTVRTPKDPQYPALYFAHSDLYVPFKDVSLPSLSQRYSLGVFTRAFETIFIKQYPGYTLHS